MRQIKEYIVEAKKKEHDDMIDVMSKFYDDETPKVGIFWYDIKNKVLFGVEKDDAEKYIEDIGVGTLHKLHRTYWNKKHHRAIAKGETSSIFYKENNYINIPRGRVFVNSDGTLFVAVGSWIEGKIHNEVVLDPEFVRELIIDEFNLPDDVEFKVDEHWNIGHGWSEDKF